MKDKFKKLIDSVLNKLGLIRKADADAAQADRDRTVKEFIRKLAAAAKKNGVNVIVDEYHMVTDKDFNSDLFITQDCVHIDNCRFTDASVFANPLNKRISLTGCYFTGRGPEHVAQRLALKGGFTFSNEFNGSRGWSRNNSTDFQTLNSSSNSIFLAESGAANFSCTSSHDSGSSSSSSSDGGSSSGGCD